MTSARALAPTLLAIVLACGSLAVLGMPAEAADPAGQALVRLDTDADGALTIRRDRSGDVGFVGVPAKTDVDNPAVTPRASVAAAADTHLARYGAALGAGAPGTTLVRRSIAPTVSGHDVVRYQQEVGGLPVLGGETVVNVRPDRELGSILSTGTEATSVESAVLTEDDAADAAVAAAAKVVGSADGLDPSHGERWVYDPTVLGQPSRPGVRSVWRFEVTGGPAVRRLLLVDDQTGAIVMNLDQIAEANRIVCDNNSALQTAQVPCTAPVRSEGGAASGVADVNTAYDYAGDTADLYGELGVDLTDLVGTTVGGVKRLASTVRYCFTGAGNCPYKNAFWNGTQMYYGAGYASGDDVVGHEITHGVTERTSNLLYFGQSGAINESISDIMGEIVDHRNGVGTDVPGNWDLGEDLPVEIGVIRNIATPPTHDQPDKLTSALYTADTVPGDFYGDSGGVHTNSGVGNKAFYLISQGGTFNGQTITGIDTGSDTGPDALIKSARLFLGVDQALTSGSDYADMAAALEQGCQDLLGSGSPGFTAADCTNIRKAVLATELTTTPTNAPQPADAPDTCPTGTVKRVLLDSETGTPSATFVGAGAWERGQSADWGSNATSGKDSWYNAQGWTNTPTVPHSESLVAQSPITLPAGQVSYLRFQQWRLLDYYGDNYYDGGTVEVDDVADVQPPAATATELWVNGPEQTISDGFASPIVGAKAFSGDSFGWVASRLDLSAYAGKTVKPQFTLSLDNASEYPGWWLDDISVYTCDLHVVSSAAPTISGTPRVGVPLTASPGTWVPATGVAFAFQWLRNAAPIAGATSVTYTPSADDVGTAITVQVAGSRAGYVPATATSAPTTAVAAGTLVKGRPSVKGKAKVGSTLLAKAGTWGPSAVALKYQWLRNGKPIRKATKVKYKLVAGDKGKKVSVKVTGTKTGYASASVTSKTTGKVKAKPKKRR